MTRFPDWIADAALGFIWLVVIAFGFGLFALHWQFG
jgi:hypothetical protein